MSDSDSDSDFEGCGKVKLRAPFCRIGSKRDIADRIIKLFPDGITTYVEPFVGSGAILWKKPPHTKEIINDLDTQLIHDYKLLKSTKARNFRNDLDTIPEIQAFVNKTPTGDANKLTYSIAKRCNTFGSNDRSKTIYKDANPYDKLKKIEDYQARLKGVTITNQSYEKVIKKYDSPSTFFYCDPPYELKKGQPKLYKHDDFNQQALRDTLASCKGKWLVSINDSANIRNIYSGFHYIAFTLKAKATKRDSIGGQPRKELFIANYPISKKKLIQTKAKALQGGNVAEGLNALAGQTGTLADIFSKILPGSSGASFLQALSGVNDIRNATGQVLGNTVNQFAPGATNIPQVKGLLSFFG